MLILIAFSFRSCQISKEASSISICPLGQINIGEENNCFSSSTENVKCCILKILRKDLTSIPNNVCWGFKSENPNDIYNYNGFNYKVFCEEKFYKNEVFNENYSTYVDESHLQSCGIARPETYSDCTSLSNDNSSCCLYTYNEIKQCTKIAKRFNGVFKYGGLKITCFSYYNKISLASLIVFFLIISI